MHVTALVIVSLILASVVLLAVPFGSTMFVCRPGDQPICIANLRMGGCGKCP